MTTVWVSPSATSYACLCEPCLEQARLGGVLFAEALMRASVRGSLPRETSAASVRCAAGHEIELRRVERPPRLRQRDERQLELA